MSPKFTYLQSNTFVLEHAGRRLFVDPWLVDDLVFGTPLFYKGVKPLLREKTCLEDFGRVDAVLLTQHLADHAHEPTLKQLPKSIPIFAEPKAAEFCADLGFENITKLDFDKEEVVTIFATEDNAAALTVRVFPGALVGPPWSRKQLACLFTFTGVANDGATSLTMYYEPHSDQPESTLEAVGKVDVALLPVKRVSIPALGNYPLVKGGRETLAACEALRPKVLLPLMNAESESGGFLGALVKDSGSIEEFREQLRSGSAGSETRLSDPVELGVPVDLVQLYRA